MIEMTVRRIKRDLDRLQRVRPNAFGSYEHDFVLNPPLPESAVDEFERLHRINLPAGYRAFIAEVANGGAGPGYGVFRLGEMDDGHGVAPWAERNGAVGVLANPFPYTERWNDLSGQPSPDLADTDETAYLAGLDAFDERYFAPVDGAIPVSHLGCATRVWLVVTGAEAGNLWLDDRASDEGWDPIALVPRNGSRFFRGTTTGYNARSEAKMYFDLTSWFRLRRGRDCTPAATPFIWAPQFG